MWSFTDDELKGLSRDLANQNLRLQDLENSKRSAQAHYGGEIANAKEQIISVSNKVTSGSELCDVECLMEFHTPERNKKTLTREDTQESWVEPMADADFNLFNQFEENEQEEAEEEDVKTDGEDGEDEEVKKPKRGYKKEAA